MKEWLKKNKWKVLGPVLAVLVLTAAFWYGGGAPGLQGWGAKAPDAMQAEPQTPQVTEPQTEMQTPTETVPDVETTTPEATAPEETKPEQTEPAETEKPVEPAAPPVEVATEIESRPGGTEGGMTADEKLAAAAAIAGGSSPGVAAGDKDYSEKNGMVIDKTTGKDKYMTDPVPEGKPLPVEPQDAVISDKEYTCTLSISCATINDNIGWLDPEKVELVPEDGWILEPTEVTFYEGESVFNLLLRTCKQQKIHMEYENTPIYNSAYIEGIHNLYEFDCGELSGWMYKVNEWFPNYGCSRYQLKAGDVVNWVYTCNLGVDVGGYAAVAGG